MSGHKTAHAPSAGADGWNKWIVVPMALTLVIFAWLGWDRTVTVREATADNFTEMVANGGVSPTQRDVNEQLEAKRHAVLPRNRQNFDIGPKWFAWAKSEGYCILPNAPVGVEVIQDDNFYLIRSPSGVQSVQVRVYLVGQMTPKGRCA